MAEPFFHVLNRNTSSRTNDADNIAHLMSRIRINPQSDVTSATFAAGELHQRQVQPLEIGVSTVITMKKEQGEYKKSTQMDLKEYNLHGLNCPICMEPWALEGDHHICCLPCGHIYGLSCINKWIKQCRIDLAKCPQCKEKVGPKNVIKLYASPVVLLEKKKSEVPDAEYLKKERSNLLLIQDNLLKELRFLKKQVCNGMLHLETTQRKSDERVTGELVHKKQNGIKCGGKVDGCGTRHCNFVLKHEMSVENARLFDIDACYQVLLLARRLPGKGGEHVLDKINMMNPIRSEQIVLPMSTKAVKDLHISPCGRLALLASLGKKLSIISMGGNNIVMTYSLPIPAWSCSWDINSPNYIYAGLQNGMLMVFDMRHTIHPVESMHGVDSRSIHTIHPLEHNTSHSQSISQLLTASTAGPCVWNINGGMQRSWKVPGLESSQGSCISLAYSCSNEEIIATYRPTPQLHDPIQTRLCTPLRSLILMKRASNSFYLKLGSTCAQLGDVWITKSTIINVENCLPMFAYGNDVGNGLRLLEIPSLTLTQDLKPHQHPILDVKCSSFRDSSVLGCLSQDSLQLFSAKVFSQN